MTIEKNICEACQRPLPAKPKPGNPVVFFGSAAALFVGAVWVVNWQHARNSNKQREQLSKALRDKYIIIDKQTGAQI